MREYSSFLLCARRAGSLHVRGKGTITADMGGKILGKLTKRSCISLHCGDGDDKIIPTILFSRAGFCDLTNDSERK